MEKKFQRESLPFLGGEIVPELPTKIVFTSFLHSWEYMHIH